MAVLMNGSDALGRAAPVRDGSEFELLFFEHYEKVLRLLCRLTGDRSRAEELANEVFWRLAQRPNRWLITAQVAPWLYRTATNVGIDALRAATRRVRYEQRAQESNGAASNNSGPLEDLLRREERQNVQRVLSGMKRARAELLLMRSCDWSYREIAEALGISIGSVGTLLTRAENDFRERYLQMVEEEKR